MATNQSLTFAKPIVIALFGPKGSGKSTAADMLGFPQYQFNQWAIEKCVEESGLTYQHFYHAALKDTPVKFVTFHGTQTTVSPRDYLIKYIDFAISLNKEGYIQANFEHFQTWLEQEEQQENYAITLPSIRREFELHYLQKLADAGYEVVCVELEREGCEYSSEHETEMRLFDSETWRSLMISGRGFYHMQNNTCPRELVNGMMYWISSELSERRSYE